jgi:two-component system phosphate regulon response regulator PhoB
VGKPAILIIEDDEDIQALLDLAFAREGWRLMVAGTGEAGLGLLEREGADCVILDLMLPETDGFKVLKKIRRNDRFRGLPVIITTARAEESDMVAGLELGADDYVVKPYSPKVLAARVRSALRRVEDAASPAREAGAVRQGALTADPVRYEAFEGERRLRLSATEFALLYHFLSNPDRVFSRGDLITAIHGADYPVTDRSVDVQILGLRKKLGGAGSRIETIRSIGYRFNSQPPAGGGGT